MWSVNFSRDALSFLQRNTRFLEDDILLLVQNAVRFFHGERINVDIKKLKGPWVGFYRIRKGDLRILAAFDFERRLAMI